jgi:hypothetical protein
MNGKASKPHETPSLSTVVHIIQSYVSHDSLSRRLFCCTVFCASPRLCFYDTRVSHHATFHRTWRSVLWFIAKTTVPERRGSRCTKRPSGCSLISCREFSALVVTSLLFACFVPSTAATYSLRFSVLGRLFMHTDLLIALHNVHLVCILSHLG